jgi:hypothetical protein
MQLCSRNDPRFDTRDFEVSPGWPSGERIAGFWCTVQLSRSPPGRSREGEADEHVLVCVDPNQTGLAQWGLSDEAGPGLHFDHRALASGALNQALEVRSSGFQAETHRPFVGGGGTVTRRPIKSSSGEGLPALAGEPGRTRKRE